MLAKGFSGIRLETLQLALDINGTQAMCAVGTLLQLRAELLADVADIAGSMTLEGLLGSHKPFIPEIQDVRPHGGQKDCAAHLRRLLADSAASSSSSTPPSPGCPRSSRRTRASTRAS